MVTACTQAADQLKALYKLFTSVDATQVEINPFGETPDGKGMDTIRCTQKTLTDTVPGMVGLWMMSMTWVIVLTSQMHDIVGWAWASTHAEHGVSSCMHMTVIRMWLSIVPTEYYTKCTYKYTAQELWVWLSLVPRLPPKIWEEAWERRLVEAVHRHVTDGLYVAAHWYSTPCALQDVH